MSRLGQGDVSMSAVPMRDLISVQTIFTLCLFDHRFYAIAGRGHPSRSQHQASSGALDMWEAVSVRSVCEC